MKKNLILLLISVVTLTGCGEYSTVLKSQDVEYKYEVAKACYVRGQYAHASDLFGELLTAMKSTAYADECLYMLAMSAYMDGDLEAASDFFRKYYTSYPRGAYAEYARYYSGRALYESVPDPRLDQTATRMAIEELQRFIDYAPDSQLKEQTQEMIQNLQDHRLLVQLPGVDDDTRRQARESIQKAAFLQFRLVHQNNDELVSKLMAGNAAPEGYKKVGNVFIRAGMPVSLCKRYDIVEKQKIKELMVFEGLEKRKVESVQCGDICAVVGIDGFEIGDTVADFEHPEALPPIAVDEPTMSMVFTINDSPFFGREGKFVTSRHIKERLERELEKNLALRVKPGVNADSFVVYGRGVLHLSILIETMRREGFELQVGQPRVLDKTIGGKRCEPVESLTIDVPEEFVGRAIEMTTRRRGALVRMETRGDRVHLDFEIPARGLMGLRSNLLTATQGEAVVAHRFKDYEPYKGDIEKRTNGSLVAHETGLSVAYAMDKLQDRGRFFIDPGEEVYAGQVVGEHTRDFDLVINICKTKKLTNVRAAGTDEKVMLPPPVRFSLEEALEYIQEDELVEVTPKSMRMRKIILDETARKRAERS